jgi:hypothetical protein
MAALRSDSARTQDAARHPGQQVGSPAAHGPTGRTARGALVSLGLLVLALVGGDAAMFGVDALVKYMYDGPRILQWSIATPVIALGAYYIFGLPQIIAWSASGDAIVVDSADIRARFAISRLRGGGLFAFVIASLIGGPLATGWYYGQRKDPRARSLTMASGWILAAAWSAVYLGVIAWAFG